VGDLRKRQDPVSDYTITLTRWRLLTFYPSAWRDVLRTLGVSPLNPYAWALFVRGVFVICTTRWER
jgi:hypothetical protein